MPRGLGDEPGIAQEWRSCGWVYPYNHHVVDNRCGPDWYLDPGPPCAGCGPDETCTAAPTTPEPPCPSR